jgi:molybdopterin-guanine dinucleotide biosynthesis protein
LASTRGEGSASRREPAEASLEYAKAHHFERQTVAQEHELLTEALRHGRGRIDVAELTGVLVAQESSGAMLRSGNEFATVESLARERSMIDLVNRGIGGHAPMYPEPFVSSDTLRPGQKVAVQFVLDSRDRAVSISGAAGTGKTAARRELRRALTESGHKVLAIAPTMSAVDKLQKVGFVDSMSVTRFVEDTRAQTKAAGAVVIVDEAGMLSTRQMHDVLQVAERFNARVVLTGDTKQIQSVAAGDALRILEKESRLKSTSLTQVQRQTKADYRHAIEELRRNPERGFAKLDEIGAVKEVAWSERAQAVASAYVATAGRSALVVCATHDEIERVTDAIRDERRRSGELGESVVVERNVSLGWTTAQKSEPRNFRPGQRLGFHRAVQGIEKNETVEVVRVEERHVVVRSAGGERKLTGKQARSFEVLESRSMEVAPGDRLLLTANRREAGSARRMARW